MPRYFFSRIPSEKKYSPGASVVAARREPIITGGRGRAGQPAWPRARRPPGSLGAGLTCGSPQGQGFGDVAHVLDSSVSDDGDPEAPRVFRHLVHGRGLGPPTGQHCGKMEEQVGGGSGGTGTGPGATAGPAAFGYTCARTAAWPRQSRRERRHLSHTAQQLSVTAITHVCACMCAGPGQLRYMQSAAGKPTPLASGG